MTVPAPTLPLNLPDVTLICVDTRTPEQAIQAMRRSQAHIDFGKAVLVAATPTADQQRLADATGIEWHTIEPLRSIGDYSRFILQELIQHVDTSHALIVQWDGFVTHPSMWEPGFLDWDYIGPPWYVKNRIHAVGNGGFSLRSRRLLAATATLPYDGHSPEDRVICVDHRTELESAHQLRFAPLDVARRFGVEQGPRVDAFGFHGIEHFAHELSAAELADWLDEAPASLIAHKHTRKLVKSLMQSGAWQQAMSLNARRAALIGWDRDLALLHARAWLSRFGATPTK